jgi:uncharacterized protein YbjT (DUF2867 family)
LKTAIVIGATGLVGNALVHQLLASQQFSKVVVLARRSTGVSHAKLEEHLINFDAPQSWQDLVQGDVLFSTLGTTLKQASSKEAQYRIDYTYQFETAAAAARNGVPNYVLVSSSGANSKSRIFYSRMKGELEAAVKKLPFRSICILQPSLLVGNRPEERLGEKLGYRVLNALNAVGVLKAYRPIQGETVAQAMVKAAIEGAPGIHVHALREIFTLAGKD